MRLLLLFAFFAGVVLVVLNELIAARPQPRVEYRYLPRDLDLLQREQPLASVELESMFKDPDVVRR